MPTETLSAAAPGQVFPDAPDSEVGGRWWLRGLLLIGAIGVIATAAALVLGTASLEESGPKLTYTITRGNLDVTVTEQGTLESSNNTEIKCKVRGHSTVIWVLEGGTEVQAGDELVRLDTKTIEDAISTQKTNAFTSRATWEESKANVAKAEIAISAYLEGDYQTSLQDLERQLAIAESNLLTAVKMRNHSVRMFRRGYVSELEVEGNQFTVTQAELELKVKQTQIKVLTEYTKEMELETRRGNLLAAHSKLEADAAGLEMDEGRLALALEELDYCIVRAESSGLVIYPSAAQWKETPDITEGATVRKDQVLLLMPDLTKMQVKVGIHESIVDRIRPGLVARVTLPEKALEGKVLSVASVTKPAGWWTGNVVKYDTIIELPSVDGLKPGMSAEVEVIMNQYQDVILIPVAAVVETLDGDFCWVKTEDGVKRRPLTLGDTDDSFLIVRAGLQQGDEVVLNPLAVVEEAQTEVLKPQGETSSREQDSPESDSTTEQPGDA